jgi:hypothetical protein
MPPRRSPRSPPIHAPAEEGAPAATIPAPRRRGRPPRQPAPPAPVPPTLDERIYNARPLCQVPAELPDTEEAEQENKIYVSHRTYEVLVGEDVPLLAVEIRNPETAATVLVTIEGAHHGEPNDVYVPHLLLERLGHPDQVNLLLVRALLLTITKVELRIMDNDYALEDPVEAIQNYLKNYYVLEEGVTLNITNQDMGITVPVYVEKIHPEQKGRIENGEVELELLRIEVEETQSALSSVEPLQATPIDSAQLQAAPLGSARLQLPMIPGYYPESYQPKEAPKIPTHDEKEKIRLARLARFASG